MERLAFPLVALVLLAGCTGLGAPPASTSEHTTTDDADSLKESPLFEYQNLTNQSKRAFQRLLDAEHVTAKDPLFGPRIDEGNYNLIRVRYDGTIYEIRHQRQRKDTRTCLQGLTRVPASRIGDDDFVANYSNLTADARSLFDRVHAGNQTDTCYRPENYPLANYTHVEHRGTYYQLNELQGSTAIFVYEIVDREKPRKSWISEG